MERFSWKKEGFRLGQEFQKDGLGAVIVVEGCSDRLKLMANYVANDVMNI